MLNFSIGSSTKIFLVTAMALMIGCQSKPKKTVGTAANGKTEPSVSTFETNKIYGVILGPGGYRTFAQAGFIKELGKQGFPVQAIVGLEWGSMIGALYALKGQPHDLDWKLFKLESRDLPKKSLLNFFSEQSSINTLDRFLKENFKGMDISQTQLKFACTSMNKRNPQLKLYDMGEMSETLKKCVAFPPLFRAQGGDWAAPNAGMRALQWLKAQGVTRVIYLDVLGEESPYRNDNTQEDAWGLLWSMAQADLKDLRGEVDWITLPVQEFSLTDFDKRRELVLRGEKSAKQFLNSVKR